MQKKAEYISWQQITTWQDYLLRFFPIAVTKMHMMHFANNRILLVLERELNSDDNYCQCPKNGQSAETVNSQETIQSDCPEWDNIPVNILTGFSISLFSRCRNWNQIFLPFPPLLKRHFWASFTSSLRTP